ncbi:WXG100 family type VII secretion target [Streptomyces sp. NPDC054796]|uniref:ESAT-6-like protein n=1 Tax=Streptomyces daliensis TaxID=299421 RepID=A0A8T4IPH3_9ACTN|nr:WXG100 family type VII secretion target [Streptomyces daliensis]
MTTGDPNQLVVTYGSLEQAAASIQQQGNQLRGDLEEIQGWVRQVADVWQGEAKEAYDRVQHTWDQKADHLHNVLLSIAAEVRVASGDYSATDKKAAQMFGG